MGALETIDNLHYEVVVSLRWLVIYLSSLACKVEWVLEWRYFHCEYDVKYVSDQAKRGIIFLKKNIHFDVFYP